MNATHKTLNHQGHEGTRRKCLRLKTFVILRVPGGLRFYELSHYRRFTRSVRLPARRYLPLLLQRVSLSAPIADSAVHGDDVGVSHFLQVIGGQRGTESAATIEDEFGL